jgi:hypothetical protein
VTSLFTTAAKAQEAIQRVEVLAKRTEAAEIRPFVLQFERPMREPFPETQHIQTRRPVSARS